MNQTLTLEYTKTEEHNPLIRPTTHIGPHLAVSKVVAKKTRGKSAGLETHPQLNIDLNKT